MHAYLPESVVEALDRQRVVKVLGVLGVDGTGPGVAEVLALGLVLLRDFARNLVGGVFHSLGVAVGQSVLGEDGVHLHIVVATLAQDVHHFAYHVGVLLVGPAHNLYHRLVVGLTFLQPLLGDEYVARQIVVGLQEGDVLAYHQLAHEGVFLALQYLYHLGLLDMVLATRHHRYPHLVAVERAHGVALRHEDGLLAVGGYE